MKSKDVVIGMKVVPTQKTVGIFQENFRGIYAVERATMAGQPFLYVIKWNNIERCWCLSDQRYESSGDHFNARDFYPYTGENHEI